MDFPLADWQKVEKITLTDGRTLAFRRIGEKSAKPALFLHGTPGSHMLGFYAAEFAIKAGYQLICPDRPGIGDSTYQENRQLRDYSLDIVQLLHHLKIKECGVVGISGGVPYSFQCAYDLPNQITFVAALSGWLSYGRDEAKGIKLERPINALRLLYKSKFLLPAVAKFTDYIVNKQPAKLLAHFRHSLPPKDVELLEDEFVRDLLIFDMQNAYKHGWKGAAMDGAIQFGNQEFQLADVKQPIVLLHGTADSVVPYEMAEVYNNLLPNIVDFITTPEGGHLCAISEGDKIFKAIEKIDK